MRNVLLVAISGSLIAGVVVLLGDYHFGQKLSILVGMPFLMAWWVYVYRYMK